MKKKILGLMFGLFLLFCISSNANASPVNSLYNETYNSSFNTDDFSIDKGQLSNEEIDYFDSVGLTGEDVEYSKVLINDGILRLPVWTTSAYKVEKSGRKATLTWGIKTNATIFEINVRINTGAGYLTGSYKPNSGELL